MALRSNTSPPRQADTFGAVFTQCLGGYRCCGPEHRLDVTSKIELLQPSKANCPFEEPALPVGIAGGTASFYRLVPAQAGTGNGDAAGNEEAPEIAFGELDWLGKDTGRSYYELQFYHTIPDFIGKPGWEILNYSLRCAGVLPEFFVGGVGERLDLLVLEDFLAPWKTPRFLDLKIGNETSAPNWKGKSQSASWKQHIVDSLTDSKQEGVRLEGFMNPPSWAESQDPGLDFGGSDGICGARKNVKTARRFAYQRLRMEEVWPAFIDLHDIGIQEKAAGVPSQCLSPGEHAEIVLLSCIMQLGGLVRACLQVPVPQKWIGSSVGVVAECGSTPERSAKSLADATSSSSYARVCLFDWGRSELSTPEMHEAMSSAERQDRAHYWSEYQAAILKVLWEATKLYWNSFCSNHWGKLRIDILDFDSASMNDCLGCAEIALPSEETGMPLQALRLLDAQGRPVIGGDGVAAEVSVGAEFVKFPAPSRMRGAWQVRVESAAHLPSGDINGNSDPFARVTFFEADNPEVAGPAHPRSTQGRTRVIRSMSNPVWSETLEFCVASPPAGSDVPGPPSSAGFAALESALASSSADARRSFLRSAAADSSLTDLLDTFLSNVECTDEEFRVGGPAGH